MFFYVDEVTAERVAEIVEVYGRVAQVPERIWRSEARRIRQTPDFLRAESTSLRSSYGERRLGSSISSNAKLRWECVETNGVECVRFYFDPNDASGERAEEITREFDLELSQWAASRGLKVVC
jgi:hypothetical protein